MLENILRVYFAGLAMQALIAKAPFRDSFDEERDDPEAFRCAVDEMHREISISAWEYADAMTVTRHVEPGTPREIKYNYGKKSGTE